MDRAYKSGASATPPAPLVSPSMGYPQTGDPVSGAPTTKPGAYWHYMVTEELRAVIVAAGLTPDQGTVNQLLQAIRTPAVTGYLAGRSAVTAQSGVMGASATRTNTLTFTAPCAGKILAIAAVNASQQQNVSVTNAISINGTSFPGDFTSLSMVNVATAAVAAGAACTITQTTTTGATAPTYSMTSQLSYIFIPGQ